MKRPHYFVDASYSNRAKTSVGAYLQIDDALESHDSIKLSPSAVRTSVFPSQSPAEAEIKTIIWLLQDILEFRKSKALPLPNQNEPGGYDQKISIYTDCQMIVQLEERRKKLEAKQFQNRFGKELKLAPLYRIFYELIDQVAPKIIWTKGHTSRADRTAIDTVFALVDQTARAKLRIL